jgi:CheY-like chemotaxis protein
VLLVEDEEHLRALLSGVLRTAGYRVLEAENGVAALETAAEWAGEIHLLLTDVVMPEMGGQELAERITALRPEVVVLYMSGYTAEPELVAAGRTDRFLQKPFTPAALAARVRELLDGRAREQAPRQEIPGLRS